MCDHLVLFDCDGVLVDSETLSAEVLATMAAELGLRLHARRGAGLPCAARQWSPSGWPSSASVPAGRSTRPSSTTSAAAPQPPSTPASSPSPASRPRSAGFAGPFCTASSAPLAKIRHTLGLHRPSCRCSRGGSTAPTRSAPGSPIRACFLHARRRHGRGSRRLRRDRGQPGRRPGRRRRRHDGSSPTPRPDTGPALARAGRHPLRLHVAAPRPPRRLAPGGGRRARRPPFHRVPVRVPVSRVLAASDTPQPGVPDACHVRSRKAPSRRSRCGDLVGFPSPLVYPAWKQGVLASRARRRDPRPLERGSSTGFLDVRAPVLCWGAARWCGA